MEQQKLAEEILYVHRELVRLNEQRIELEKRANAGS